MITCPICDKQFKALVQHIIHIHKMTIKRFKEEYPNHSIVSDETRALPSTSLKAAGVGKWRKGRLLSNETKAKISKAVSGENNGFYGKKHTDETRKKMSANHADFTGDKNPFKSWIKDPDNKQAFNSILATTYSKRRERNDQDYIEMCDKRSRQSIQHHIDGRIQSYGRGHKHGTFTSIRQTSMLSFRSSYEERFLHLCEAIDNLEFTPCHFSIPYIKTEDGRRHRYIPDFKLNSNIIVEIKPSKILKLGLCSDKLDAGKQYCIGNNMVFIVIDENDLTRCESDNRYLVHILNKHCYGQHENQPQ